LNKLKLAIVSFGFLGCSPFAPGTFGTLGGVAIAWLLAKTPWFPLWALLACAVLYAISAPLGAWAERYAGKKDPGIFVVDEVIGYLITVLWTGGPSLLALVVAFFVFRFFDIVKPPPARRMERIRRTRDPARRRRRGCVGAAPRHAAREAPARPA
jgi:phosphatidylglycerophosphatase A